MRALKSGDLILGSCLDPEVGLPSIADKSVDHVVTDPPYEDYVHAAGKRLSSAKDETGAWCTKTVNMTFDAIRQEDRVLVAEHIVRICKGWVLLFCSLEGVRPWQDSLVEAGAKRRNTCLWVKTNAAPKMRGNGPAAGAEAIVTAWCGEGDSTWNAGGMQGVYRYATEMTDRRHSCQKPMLLMRQLLLDFTCPGDLILDPYLGGGTTAMAAKSLDRGWAGYEITASDLDIARKAISKAVVQTHMEQVMFQKKRKHTAYGKEAPPKAAEQLSLLAPSLPKGALILE